MLVGTLATKVGNKPPKVGSYVPAPGEVEAGPTVARVGGEAGPTLLKERD
jgi:hypothetical protein